MSANHSSIHRTMTSPFTQRESGGWEFYCHECGYYVRYWLSSQPGYTNLEILNAGDPVARHTSSNPLVFSSEESSSKSAMGFTEDAPENPSAGFDEENWLTPEVRTQLEKILQAFDEN